MDTKSVAGAVDTDGAAELLAVLEQRNLVRFHDGAMQSWMLTPDGRKRGQALLAQEMIAAGAETAMRDGYSSFGKLNRVFLELCTDWQVRMVGGELIVNDHRDSVWDAGVFDRLRLLHDQIIPVCMRLGEALSRFDGYEARLVAAYRRIVSGDVDWFTRPVIDSYHTVWMELHEDLLASLGIERAKEVSP